MELPFKKAILKNLFKVHLNSEQELDEFAEWAFGKDFLELGQGMTFVKRWNDSHGDKYMINSTDRIVDSAPIMIGIWKDACRDK